jgi:secreted PhoX family phosphatase
MNRTLARLGVAAVGVILTVFGARPSADDRDRDRRTDFGSFVADALRDHSMELFGFHRPLDESAIGPFDGPSVDALELAGGLKATLISSAVENAADQIAMWPDDAHPTHLFVCDEETTNPAVQRVDLSKPAGSNATAIVIGLSSCDPVRRTPWGTIIVAEEAGANGGLYELFDPVHITTPITVTDRGTGANTDPLHLVKRKAVGALSFESFGIMHDGTMIYGDELAPSAGNNGGGIYKFVPAIPFGGGGPITIPAMSPLASGTIYGLRVAASGSSNWGQGAEIGNGSWTLVNAAATGVTDASGNIILRNAQLLQRFTGYYRPEDMDVDPIALAKGVFRVCWANTGRLSHAGGSAVENAAVYGEVMCLTEEPPSAAVPTPPTGTIPKVDRFIAGTTQLGMPDNVAFQPHTGNLVVLEDGPTSIVLPNGTSQPRGNDMWICLPDGADADVMSDGCVRFASLRDTSSEPTGFIFLASGEAAFVHLQHRDVDAANHRGSLLMITGFTVDDRERDHEHDRDRH